MKNIITLLLMFTVGSAMAQRFNIKGQLMDDTGSGMPSATVMLLNANDSSLVNFSVSDTQGRFEIKNVANGNWLIKVTYTGFKTITRKVGEPQNNLVDLGQIRMAPASKELDEVTVTGERIPVVVKKDTIEYNAASFKTQNNAVVEDLLKRLPGVEVESDGSITAQGEQVRRVTVDGKEFFGRDPKLATQNLPADAVEKVQIIDRKSEQSQFSGIDDGQREKTINLELKEDKKKGAFGNTQIGIGTNERWQGKTNINRFSKGSQLSFLGMANNINQQGFSFGEYMNFTGASTQAMGGGGVNVSFNSNNASGVPINFGGRGNGITTNYAAGLNGNKTFSPKTELNGSYFFNLLDVDVINSLTRENFQPDPANNFNYFENSAQNNFNNNHRANVTLDHKIDSANSLRFNGNFSVNQQRSFQESNSQTLRPNGELQNSSEQISTNDGGGYNWNGSLLLRHRFKKKGRTISANTDVIMSQNDAEGTLQATNSFLGRPDNELNQINTQSTGNQIIGTNFSYTEPLGGRKYLEASYNIRTNRNQVDRSVFDINGEDRTFNDTLSNKFSSTYLYQRGGLNFRMNRQKFNFTVGTGLQVTQLRGLLEIQDVPINNNFQNILPVARFNYEFTSYRRMSLDYETSVQEPSIQQLQPVVDNRNPLNIYEGNPELQPAYRNNWRLSFNNFNPAKFVGVFAFVDATYTTNDIVNSQTVDENFVRYTQPVNVPNALRLRANGNLSFPIRKINSRLNIGTTLTDNYSVTLLNNQENNIRQSSLGGNIRYNYRFKEFADINLSANLNQQLTAYEFNQPDQAFLNQTYTVEGLFSFWKHYQFTTNFTYLKYENQSANFSEVIPLLDMAISRSFLKGNAGELKLSGVNLLNRNVGVSQSANINYLERSVSNNLGQYYMLTFTYALNRQLNPMGGGGRRGGGSPMRMMMIN